MFENLAQLIVTHEALISSMASIAAVISLAFAAVALFLNMAAVRRGNRVNQASVIYQIQKDAREAARELLSDKVSAAAILGKEIEDKDRIRAQVGQLFNFYSAVFQQKRLEVLDDQLWKPIEADLNAFVATASAREFWDLKKDSGEYDPDFTLLVNEILAVQPAS